ncbi:MAG: complex I subunit 4 family protein [Candidatus Micrarchaeia archaeon]
MFYIGITLLVLLVGALLVLMTKEKNSRVIGLASSGLALLLIIAMFASASLSINPIQNENYGLYITPFNIHLQFQINIFSLILTLMSAIVAFTAILGGDVELSNTKGKTFLLLLFELSAIALFSSTNLFLFYIFFDFGVIIAFFMIYLYGGANKRRASLKFIAYEFSSSMLLLIAIILLYTSAHTFNINLIIQNINSINSSTQIIIFTLLLIAFMINMPIFPFHSWLPDAYTEAPTQGSMILGGILSKFGGYGLLLTFLMLPISHTYNIQVILLILGIISTFYAAFILMSRHDLKRIIAYSAIIEMGIVLVGIASLTKIGFDGALIVLFAQGVTIALMFIIAGSIEKVFEERDTRFLRGVIKSTLSDAYSFTIGIFALGGIPLSIGFIGDLLIFTGALNSFSIFGIIPLFALLIGILFLYYINSKSILNTYGEISKSINSVKIEQKLSYAILIFTLFFFGIFPFLFTNFFKFLI